MNHTIWMIVSRIIKAPKRGRGKSRRIGGEMQTGISVGSRMRGRGTVREGERRGEAMSE